MRLLELIICYIKRSHHSNSILLLFEKKKNQGHMFIKCVTSFFWHKQIQMTYMSMPQNSDLKRSLNRL